EIGQYLGTTTNNVAEYSAVLLAHQWLEKHSTKDLTVQFFLDSLLVCSQLNGVYKIKEPRLQKIRNQISKYEQALQKQGITFTYKHVRREFNKDADRQVNKALDE